MRAISLALLFSLAISFAACKQYIDVCPIADAGPAPVVDVGCIVQLDGSASISLTSNPLTYLWSFVGKPEGSTAALSDPTAVAPYFTVDLPGEYFVALVVHDGICESDPDILTISTFNTCPMASAGPDMVAYVGDTITLDGSGVDEDGDPLTYLWSLIAKPEGSGAELSDPLDAAPTLTIDLSGVYVAELVVDDGVCLSGPDGVIIGTFNLPPTAEAGPNQEILIGSTAWLDGLESSDLDGDVLSFWWSMLSKPSGSSALLSDPYAANPTFYADIEGDYVIQLIVNDGEFDSEPDTCMVTAVVPLCPKGKGYWKNHPGEWPVEQLGVGGKIYDAEELANLLGMPARGDASIILTSQLIAAKLNVAHGSDPVPIDDAAMAADALLGEYSDKLPYKVKPKTSAGQSMIEQATVLERYKSGWLTLTGE